MAGTITVTSAEYIGTQIVVYIVAWVATAGGVVSVTPFSVRRGFLRQVRFKPDIAPTQPSAGYDLTLLDANGIDVLLGTGANLSDTAVAVVCPILSDGAASPLQSSRLIFLDSGAYIPTIANAGVSTGGTFMLYVGGGVGS